VPYKYSNLHIGIGESGNIHLAAFAIKALFGIMEIPNPLELQNLRD
jgi:hypothetical protein